MKINTLLFILSAAVVALPARANEGGSEHGAEGAAAHIPVEERAATCATCHYVEGEEEGGPMDSVAPVIPRIAGQYESYIEHALKEYRAGRRENELMNAQAAALTDQDIAELAHYFSNLPGSLGTANRNP